MRPFYFELENGEHDKITESEEGNHEITWIKKEDPSAETGKTCRI